MKNVFFISARNRAVSFILIFALIMSFIPVFALSSNAEEIAEQEFYVLSAAGYGNSVKVNLPYQCGSKEIKARRVTVKPYNSNEVFTVLNTYEYEPFIFIYDGEQDINDSTRTLNINDGEKYKITYYENNTPVANCLFTANSADSGTWTDSDERYDISWYNENDSVFSINTAAQLAGLAYLVNIEGETFSGETIEIPENTVISLKNIAWSSV